MGPEITTRVEHAVAALAAKQEGLVAARQLLALGLTRKQLRAWRERGWLIPVRPGVYAVGHVPTAVCARWWAALLSIGDDAVLSHDSAAKIARVFTGALFPIHVTAVRSAPTKQPRLVLHRVRHLDRLDWVTTHDDLRITALPLTLIDLAGAHDDATLLTALEAMRKPLHIHTMRRSLERHAGRRGAKRTRKVLDAYQDQTRSYLERAFLRLCREHGIPKPDVNQHIAGHERDFCWPSARLVVEVDGRAFHGTPRDHAKDDRRDVELGIAGWRVHRFSYEQIVLDPAGTARDLRRLLDAR